MKPLTNGNKESIIDNSCNLRLEIQEEEPYSSPDMKHHLLSTTRQTDVNINMKIEHNCKPPLEVVCTPDFKPHQFPMAPLMDIYTKE